MVSLSAVPGGGDPTSLQLGAEKPTTVWTPVTITGAKGPVSGDNGDGDNSGGPMTPSVVILVTVIIIGANNTSGGGGGNIGGTVALLERK